MRIVSNIISLFWCLGLSVIWGQVESSERSQSVLDPPLGPKKAGFSHPGLQYVVILDAGSTGTRAHIHAYQWRPTECFGRGAVKLMMPGWMFKVRVGLASWWQLNTHNGKPSREKLVEDLKSDYLAPIYAFINETLRQEDFQNTILLLRATGGFRNLSLLDQQAALDAAYDAIKTWPIPTRREWMKVLTGQEEGAFSWLAINQLARRFYEPLEHVQLHPLIRDVSDEARQEDPLPGSWLKDNWRAEATGHAGRRVKQRIGMIEVGGASAQIALEPPAELRDQLLDQLDLRELKSRFPVLQQHPVKHGFHILKFCHENFVLQIQSLDGYGRQAAFQNFLRFSATRNKTSAVTEGGQYEVACLPPDVTVPITLGQGAPIFISEDSNQSLGAVAFVHGSQLADAEICRQHVREFLKSTNLPPIPFKVDEQYRIYATENFYYFNQYVNQAHDVRFSAAEFWETAKNICSESSVSGVRDKIHSEAAPEKGESACFGLVFMSEFLNSIVSLPPTQLMKAVTAVKELDMTFAVGSLLTELPGIKRSMAGATTVAPPRKPSGKTSVGDEEL